MEEVKQKPKRVLDRSKPFVEVFGEDERFTHRFTQYGMTFDDHGNLIGEEKEVPIDDESKEAMEARLRREIRAQVEQEHREAMAEAAKTGGGDGTKAAAKKP